MPEYAQAVVDGWTDAELLRLHLHELPRSLMGLDRERRIELLAERPPMTGTPWDVLLAAMVEHVCELHDLEPPRWSQEPERFVDIPHFFTTRHDYIETVVYAPAAFVRHGALANARDLDARGGEKHVWIPGSRPDPTAFDELSAARGRRVGRRDRLDHVARAGPRAATCSTSTPTTGSRTGST